MPVAPASELGLLGEFGPASLSAEGVARIKPSLAQVGPADGEAFASTGMHMTHLAAPPVDSPAVADQAAQSMAAGTENDLLSSPSNTAATLLAADHNTLSSMDMPISGKSPAESGNANLEDDCWIWGTEPGEPFQYAYSFVKQHECPDISLYMTMLKSLALHVVMCLLGHGLLWKWEFFSVRGSFLPAQIMKCNNSPVVIPA